MSAARSLAALARPHLAALVRALGEDAGLALPDGHDVVYVDQVECDHPVQVRDWTGTRAPLHTVPSGLVLLAEWPERALGAYLGRGLVALTPRTTTDPDALRARLEEARRVGYAWGREEYAEGITSVAAPIRDARGHAVAAIHVHGPSYRFPPPGEEERVASEVVAAAQAVSRSLRRESR
ncbi:MAG: IclR family transcriptional regulator [Gaiellaceae bacterium]|nr:IclR family transcriptional regulator [Gaiellaceae bacterium]